MTTGTQILTPTVHLYVQVHTLQLTTCKSLSLAETSASVVRDVAEGGCYCVTLHGK